MNRLSLLKCIVYGGGWGLLCSLYLAPVPALVAAALGGWLLGKLIGMGKL